MCRFRKKQRRRVVVFGTFDILHDGHKDLFAQARAHGDSLSVVIARDVTVENIKGRPPKHSECIRYWTVLQDANVDDVCFGGLGDKYEVLEKLRPHVICIGYDQVDYVKELGNELIKRGLGFVQVKKLESYYPEKYKSSKLAPDKKIVSRAKRHIRELVLREDLSLDTVRRDAISNKIRENLKSLQIIRDARTVSVFIAGKQEIQTKTLIRWLHDEGKTVVIPKLAGVGYMKMNVLQEDAELIKNSLGFLEPLREDYYEKSVDACIMPCVACDEKGNRLGRGLGYFDKYLSLYPCENPIIVACEAQLVSCIPIDKFDLPASIVATEERIINC